MKADVTAHDTQATYVEEAEQGAVDIIDSIERRFGFTKDRWGESKLEAEPRFICPICHEPRERHGCTTSTGFSVDDNRRYTERRSTVSMHVFCHHPDTFEAVAAARRYHRIEPTGREE